jgi:hypothetical protein
MLKIQLLGYVLSPQGKSFGRAPQYFPKRLSYVVLAGWGGGGSGFGQGLGGLGRAGAGMVSGLWE